MGLPSAPISTGNVASLWQPRVAAVGVLRRLEEAHEGAVVDGQQRVHGRERTVQGLIAGRTRLVVVNGVLDLHGDVEEGVRPVGPARRDAHLRRHGPPPAHDAAHDVTVLVLDGIDLDAGVEVQTHDGAGTGDGQQRDGGQVDLVLDGFGEVDVGDAADDEAVDRPERAVTGGTLDAALLDLQAADADAQHGDVAGVDDHLGAVGPALRAVGLRPPSGRQHPEGPADLVLPRRRPVRVEHVALVEHGVGDGAAVANRSAGRAGSIMVIAGYSLRGRARRPERRRRAARGARGSEADDEPAVGHGHGSSTPASLKRCSNASSQPVTARSALKRCSRSRVCRLTRIHALSGK